MSEARKRLCCRACRQAVREAKDMRELDEVQRGCSHV